MPLLPVLLELERAAASGRRSGARCADRWTPAAGPGYFTSAGLGSNMSTCDGPPVRNRMMTCLAFARHARTGCSGPAAARPRAGVRQQRGTARPRPRRRTSIESSCVAISCSIIARKSPRCWTATPAHIARPCPAPDSPAPGRFPSALGSRDSTLRYRLRTFRLVVRFRFHRRRQRLGFDAHERAVHDEKLLQRRGGQVAASAGLHRIGEIVDLQQIAQPPAADTRVDRTPDVGLRLRHPRTARTSCRSGGRRSAAACRDRIPHPAAADSCATTAS